MANKNLYVLIFVIAQLLLYVQARCQSDYVPFYTPNGLFDRIFDRFGNEYYLDDIRIRPGINGMSLEPCQAGYFNLWIEEDSGFYGLENTTRRETLCRVFSDLSNFIIPVNVSNLVDIRVYGNSDSDYLGSATQYHQEYAPASGITKGTVWHSINSGINSMGGGPLDNLFGINFFKGGLTIDWDHLWNENFNEAPNPNEFDLYSVILHEVTHLLGFASLIRLNGEGLQTYLQNFYYSSYDTFLHTNTNIQLITNAGCTLYEHQFNPLLNSQLLLAPGTGLPCPDSAPNNTDCSTAVRYFGNVNQSLYTGACHSQGSTLSHFADDCYTIQPGFNEPAPFPTLNQYYVMSIATPPGIIKRFLRPEERMTLCDLGYHVSTTFGSIESLNFYDYFEEDGDVTCNINPTAGLNDGIENNQYLWINTLQTPFNFLGSDILQNDINADEFLCLEIISGEGTLSATSGSNETVVSVVALSAGIIVFRYVPYNSITGKYGNITYGYFYILDQTCYTPCSIIPNGEFENYYTNCGFPLSNKSHCWNELTSSNLSSIYLGPNCSSADILGFWNSEPFVYDNSDISNDHCIGIQSISGNSGVIQNLLTEPLITGETYQFQYWAKVSPLSPVDELSLEIGFSEYLLLSIGDLEEAQIIYPFATVNVANDGLWHFITVPDFVYQGPEGYQNFVLSLTTSNELGSGISGFLLVDGISLKKTTTDVHFSSIANELVVGETIHNLENSVNISGGVFSGNGVNCMDGACSFNSGIAGIGVHTLSYTIIDANGCPCSTYHVVIVNAGVSIESDTNPICTVPGEPVTLIASGAITYSWTPVEGLNITSGPIVVATPLVTTTYTVQGVNEFGITSTSTITVVPQLPFELSYTLDPGNTLCEVNSSDINLSLFGAYTYSVNPINSWEEITEGNFQIQANEIELYSDYELIGYSQEGCTAMELLAFELNPEIIISETISFDNCESSADIDITLSGGTEPFSINWGNLPIDFDPLLEDQNNLTSGNYTVQIEDSNNCINLATFEIETFSEITANFMVNSPICPETNNGEISISELSGGCDGTILFNWTGPNGYTSSNQNIANLSSGLYHVSIEDTNCSCISIYDIEVPAANWDEPNNLLINTEEQVNNWTGNTISFGGNITFASDFATIIGNNDVETTFILSSSSHIIIDEGSNISFVNCVFTSCGNHWKGFEILSDALFDNEDPSGQLTLLNCSISYAEIAIFTTDGFPLLEEVLIIDSEGNVTSELVPVYEGGIISATNTSFLNNLRSVKIRQSIRWAQDTPETSFTNCSFIVNDGLADHFFDIDYTLPWNSFKSHVSYDEVIGYSFINCTFENNFVNLANQGGWGGWGVMGSGIKSFNSRFEVNINEEEGAQSLFEGFKYAIQAHNTDGFFNFLRIVNSKFRNNQVAMYFHDVCYHDVIGNDIQVGPNITMPTVLENAEVDYEGIYQLNGAWYIIAENEITGIGEPIDDNFFVGIRIRDNQARDNEVYHNYLRNLTRGCQAEGDNTGNGIWENFGLRFVCNHFVNCNTDLSCTDFNNNNLMEVSHVQFGLLHDVDGVPEPLGTTEDLDDFGLRAGNDFTFVGFTDQTDFGHWHNDGSQVTYWCGEESECPFIDELNPENSLVLNVDKHETFGLEKENACLEIPGVIWNGVHVSQPQLPNSWETSFNNWDNEVHVGKYLKLSLIDGGDTETLQNQVEFAWSEDTWAMREQLLSKSPFLSRDVLRRVANNTLTFPHPIALEIFIANPDVLRDATFMRYLETKNDPMPAYMVDILYGSRDQITMRTLIDRNMAIANAYQAQTLSLMHRVWSNDYTSHLDEIINSMNMEQMLDNYIIIDGLLNAGRNTEAHSVYVSMGQSIRMNEQELLDYEAYADWINLEIDRNDWQNGTLFSPAQLVTINNLVDNHWMHRAGQKALSFMNLHMGTDFYIPPARNNWQPRNAKLLSDTDWETAVVEVYPNPANEIVTFEFHLSENSIPKGSLAIYDISNRLIEEFVISQSSQMISIDSRQWQSGLYMFIVKISGDVEHAGRFEIIH